MSVLGLDTISIFGHSTSNQHDFKFKKTSTTPILVKFGEVNKGNPKLKKNFFFWSSGFKNTGR